MLPKLLIFDLDGTLLRSDKTISTRTHEAIRKCRERGTLVAISTVRGEKNIVPFVDNLRPDLVIACSGALVKNE
ncbi:MAG: HAD hydrolase family protein, partial [Firmicutes bacterium]|nr:HAD hydrolase family protein [Bacillota bacterium]